MEDLINGIVCILDAYSRPAGTGFVVSTVTGDLIVTCAHVLGKPRPEQVMIVFQATDEQREAKLIDQWWRSEEAEDVAILQIVGGLPLGVQPLPLGSAKGTAGHNVSTFGFPNVGQVKGVGGDGTVIRQVTTIADLSLLQLRSSEITPGFSGAPVWDKLRHRVIGMVSEITLPDQYSRLTETAFAVPTETLRIVCPVLRISEVCPYRSLEIFTEADTAFFFGRQRVIDELVESLQAEPHFLAVLGPSGSGKSSVVQAGLIPRLRQGAIPGSDRWEIRITRPADPAFSSLLSAAQQTRLQSVLIIDQFEELFVASSRDEQQDSITHLTELLEYSPRISIILVLRDDFYSRFAQQETLVRWLKGRTVNIPPLLKRDEMKDMIQEPARAVGLRFEEGLVEAIVKDGLEMTTYPEDRGRGGRSTVLPLLEFTLAQLWERREEGILSYAAYERIGGITGGLAQWANEAFSALEKDQHPLARRIFTDLVYLGSEEQSIPDSRRQRLVTSLFRSEDEQEVVSQMVRQLVNARLLVASRDGQNQEETVEIIHEALLHEWSELRRWIADDRRFLIWHQELERRIRAWIDTNAADVAQRDADQLLRGRELVEAESWMGERKTDLTSEEQRFIEASRERQQQEEARWKELYEEAERQRQVAIARQLAAQAELLRNQGVGLLDRSVLLAVESMRRSASLEAEYPLRRGLALLARPVTHMSLESAVTAVAFSPDNTVLAAATESGIIQVWEEGREVTRMEVEDRVNTIAFSPGGRYLVITSKGAAQVLEAVGGQKVISVPHNSGDSVAFSPDERYLATIDDKSAQVWKVPSGEQVAFLPHEAFVRAVAFSPDGQYLATGSGNWWQDWNARIWEVPSGREVMLMSHEFWVNDVAFSPDGTYLATASEGGYKGIREALSGGVGGSTTLGPDDAAGGGFIHAWEISSGREITRVDLDKGDEHVTFSPDWRYRATLSRHTRTARVWEMIGDREVARAAFGGATTVAFTWDGRYLATGSHDGIVRIWKNSTGRELARIDLEEPVVAAAASPDGRYLIMLSKRDDKWAWRPYSMPDITEDSLFPRGTWMGAVAFSPDGRYLVTGAQEKVATILDLNGGQELAHLEHKDQVETIAFSSDGHYLATGSDDGIARVWKMPKGRRAILRIQHGAPVNAVAFSPDGRYLATGSSDQTAQVWEVIGGSKVAQVAHEELVKTVAFSPDGRYLATGSEDQTAGIWEIASGREVVSLPHESWVMNVAFNSDGHYLATGSYDGIARVWEVPSGREVAHIEIENILCKVAFSSDGRYLATITADGTAQAWLVWSEDLIAEACDRLIRNLTPEEWQQYLANEPYRKTCPNLP